MSKNWIFLSLFGAILLFGSMAFSAQDEVIVRFTVDGRERAERILNENEFDIVKRIPQLDMFVAKPRNQNTDRKKLMKSRFVKYVENNGVIQMFSSPDERRYKSQWHHKNIQSEIAWQISTGSRNVVVAVIDTGVSLKHEDLKKQIWVNEGEIADNGVDDDQNGFIDDVNGWDFLQQDNNPNDDQSHGSHCAGLIGAEGNNGIGVVGMTWNVKIMPLKFLSSKGSGSEADAVLANIYAADNGAHIISSSWGSTGFSQALYDSTEYAAQKGVLYLAAAGNSSNDADRKPHFPSGFRLPNMISVGASTKSNGKASFSNYGRTSVHVAAPGDYILSADMGKSSYSYKSGTSMATPIVAGMAALMLSIDPDLDMPTLRNAILNSVETTRGWEGRAATDGIIRASLAVTQLTLGAQLWPQMVRIPLGESFQFTPYKDKAKIWSVSDTSVAQIDKNGVVTAIGVGQTEVLMQGQSGLLKALLRVVEKK